VIPSSVYFTLFPPGFFFLFQPANNNKHYTLPSADTYEYVSLVLEKNSACVYMKKKFIRFSIRSLSLMLAA
jgi:hypothetical protein